MEIISNIALISINETLVVQLVCFLIFVFILNRIMIRPLRGSARDRDHYIAQLSTDITAAHREMRAIAAQIESQETDARQAARTIQKDIIAQGSQEAQEILVAANQDVVTLRQQTKAEIDTMVASLRQNLMKEAELIAIDFMEKALNRRLSQ